MDDVFTLCLSQVPFPVSRYPFDAIVVPTDWEGWAHLRSHQVCVVNERVQARVMKGDVGEPKASKRMLRLLGDARVTLRPVDTLRFRGYSFQPLEDTGKPVINLPVADYEALPPAAHYRVACPATGCAFVVSADNVSPFTPGHSGEEGTIKLSRYQRILLRLHPPLELNLVQRGELTAETKGQLGRFYEGDPQAALLRLKPELSYEDTVAASRALRQSEFFSLLVSPVVDDECDSVLAPKAALGKKKFTWVRRAWYRLGEFYLGTQTFSMRVVRPLDIDESRTAVRLTRDTMNSLGIDEMDVVQVRYGARTAIARAMAIGDEEQMRTNSHIADSETLDAVIGVPAGLRAQLGIPSINECVEVERDANHMFRKSLNLYLVSALAWFFTVVQVVPLVGLSMGWTALVFLLSMPVIAYVAASGKRAQVKDLGTP